MRFSYFTRGEGKDVVLFHGYGASKECFLPLANYLSKQFCVTAFDFPGFGESEKLSFPLSVSNYADEVENFLFHQGIVHPHVLAHSFGARVAVKMASRRDAFDKILLTGPAGIISNRTPLYRAKVLSYRLVKKLFPDYAETHFGSKEYRSLSPVMKESYKKIVNEDLRRDAEKIQSPVLILEGEKDTATPLKEAKIYCKHLKNGSLTVLKGCSHFAFLDDPLTFFSAAEEFFS